MIIFKTPDFDINTFMDDPIRDSENNLVPNTLPNRNHKHFCDSIAITDKMLNCDIIITELPYYQDGENIMNYEVLINEVYFYTQKQEIARLIFRALVDMKNNPKEYLGVIFNEKFPEIGI